MFLRQSLVIRDNTQTIPKDDSVLVEFIFEQYEIGYPHVIYSLNVGLTT